MGLDPAMAPSTAKTHTNIATGDADLLPEFAMKCVALLGSSSRDRNSSQMLL